MSPENMRLITVIVIMVISGYGVYCMDRATWPKDKDDE